jgi:hypothetical protein
MFYGVVSMIIVEKYPTDMGFMFGIANVTAGFVLFFLTNYIASNTDFLDQIMVNIFSNNRICRYSSYAIFSSSLESSAQLTLCILFTSYEKYGAKKKESKTKDNKMILSPLNKSE